jgi:hypothetical protein
MNFAPVDELHETHSRTAAYNTSFTKRYGKTLSKERTRSIHWLLTS